MRVFRKTHAFVTLTQKDKRAFAKDPTIKYAYSLARIIIGKIGQKSNEITAFSGIPPDLATFHRRQNGQ